MLSYPDKCTNTIVSGEVVDTIYFHLAKAFDSVPPERLLGKLRSCGISDKVLLEWIKAFLSNHRQIVNVNRMKSDPATVLSGIPQSRVVGPVIFVIYMYIYI